MSEISEAWLRNMGFEIRRFNDGGNFEASFEWNHCWCLHLYDDGDLLVSDGNPDGGIKWPVKVKLKGQLLAICRALAITLSNNPKVLAKG